MSLPGWKLRSFAKAFDALATAAAVAAQCLDAAPRSQGLETLKAAVLLRAFVMLRLLTVPRSTRSVVETVYRIRDVLFLFVCVFFLIIYVYASVALDLFKDVLPSAKFTYDADDPTGPDDDVVGQDVYLQSFYHACLQPWCSAFSGRPDA